MGRSLCIKNIWNKKTTRRREKEKQRKRKQKKKRKRKKSKRKHDKLHPTAKNRPGNLQSRVAGQLL